MATCFFFSISILRKFFLFSQQLSENKLQRWQFKISRPQGLVVKVKVEGIEESWEAQKAILTISNPETEENFQALQKTPKKKKTTWWNSTVDSALTWQWRILSIPMWSVFPYFYQSINHSMILVYFSRKRFHRQKDRKHSFDKP